MLTVKILVPSASLLNLFSSPVVLVPTPGPNRVLVPVTIWVSIIYGGAVYTAAGDVELRWGNTGRLIETLAGFKAALLNPGTGYGSDNPITRAPDLNGPSLFADLPICLGATVSNPTLGNSDAVVSMTYMVLDLS